MLSVMQQLIRLKALMVMLGGVSEAWVYRHEKAGDFPARVRLAQGTVAWRLADVEVWVRDRPRGPAERPLLAEAARNARVRDVERRAAAVREARP